VKWFLGSVIAGVGVAGLAAVAYLLFVGPRMYDQPHIRAFQAEFPPMPDGVAAVEEPVFHAPSDAEAETRVNPLADTPENRARGAAYYRYYCAFCHGEEGDGNGPVGESYVPRPADLRTPKIRAYADGRLLRAMLVGTGHEPVLGQVVRPEHRGYLVLYTRALARGGAKGDGTL
jgi:hypothetical protein